MIKPTLSISQLAEKHGVSTQDIIEQLSKGTKVEMEHTTDAALAEKIALHHIEEMPDYYDKLDIIENQIELTPQEFIAQEKSEAQDVMICTDSRLVKTMICKAKMELCQKMSALENITAIEANTWNECANIWKDALNNVVNGTVSMYKLGGKTPCGCTEKYKKGGLAYGNSHDKGGIPLTVKSTNQQIEIEGGEGVVNKRSMAMSKEVEFEGEKMTPCEVISKINQMGGGVKFKCEDVTEIMDKDGSF